MVVVVRMLDVEMEDGFWFSLSVAFEARDIFFDLFSFFSHHHGLSFQGWLAFFNLCSDLQAISSSLRVCYRKERPTAQAPIRTPDVPQTSLCYTPSQFEVPRLVNYYCTGLQFNGNL